MQILREDLELIKYDSYEVEGRSVKEQREIIKNLGFDYNLYNFNSYSGNDWKFCEVGLSCNNQVYYNNT